MRIMKMLMLAFLFIACVCPLTAPGADKLPVLLPEIQKVDRSTDDYAGYFNGCSLACALGWTLSASSFLPAQGKITYNADNVDDGDPATAWCEGARGDGIGEWIQFTLEAGPAKKEVNFNGITIANGYLKNDSVWGENNRVKTLRFELNGHPVALMKLADSRDLQFFSGGPVKEVRPGDKLRFVIQEVYPGSKYHDTCISDMVLQGAH